MMDYGGLLEALRSATHGDLQIIRELGRGGMAAVYLAHDLHLERDVAVKVMLPSQLGHEDAPKRFLQEARTAARLDHPNIIPIYSVHWEGGLFYFVMKCIQGKALDAIINDDGRLPIPLVTEVLSAVAGALSYAHGRRVIHRDIKPGNIMIDIHGAPIVMDFGIAKVPQETGLTRAGAAIGTPKYMSPEQCRGEVIAGSSDQYSLGIVAYQMLTGEAPFDAPSIPALMLKQLSEPVPPLRLNRADCPESLVAVVERMLAKDPADRWPSMTEMVAAIGEAPREVRDVTRTALIAIVGEPEVDLDSGREHEAGSALPSLTKTMNVAATPVAAPPDEPATDPDQPAPDAQPAAPERARAPTKKRGFPLLWSALGIAAISVSAFFIRAATQSPGEDGGAVASLTLDPETTTMLVDDTVRLAAVALDTLGSPLDGQALGWETEDEAVATVSVDGMVTAISEGTTRITVSLGDSVAEAVVSVTANPPPGPVTPARTAARNPVSSQGGAPGVVAAISGLPAAMSLEVGERRPLQARAVDRGGADVASQTMVWESEDPTVAQVQPATLGHVLVGLSEASTRVRARVAGVVSEWADVTVSAEPVASIVVEPSALSLEVGEAQELTAILRGTRTAVLDRAVNWQSTAPAVASVDASGRVEGVGAGSAEIVAGSGTRSVRIPISVSGGARFTSGSAAFEVDTDAKTLTAVWTLVMSGTTGDWCADFAYEKDGEAVGNRQVPFQVTGSGSSTVRVPLTFDDLGLARRGSETAQVGGSMRVWATACASAANEGPLGAAQAQPVCIRRRFAQDWTAEACDG